MNELHLFAGAGGGILGGMLLGHTCVCAVEIESYPRKVLLQRQRDGILPRFPIWDDITTFDGKPWRGKVDIVCGGFPCQDISAAGKGAGINGERSGLWREMARIIGEVRPAYVLVENSPMLVVRGLSRVIGDLTALGYDCRWGVVGAVDAGAPHKRDRIWIVAHSKDERCMERSGSSEKGKSFKEWSKVFLQQKIEYKGDDFKPGGMGCSISKGSTYFLGCAEQQTEITNDTEYETIESCRWWETEPDVGRVANGVASRVDRLKAIGNGQVPAVVTRAWKTLRAPLARQQAEDLSGLNVAN